MVCFQKPPSLVLEKENETLKTDISDADEFSVMFDGNSRLEEVLAIVLRYIDTEWNIQQKLLKLETLSLVLRHFLVMKILSVNPASYIQVRCRLRECAGVVGEDGEKEAPGRK